MKVSFKQLLHREQITKPLDKIYIIKEQKTGKTLTQNAFIF